jgi:DNA mismatch repair protein MutS2
MEAARAHVTQLIAKLQATPDMREAQRAQKELTERAQEATAQANRERGLADVRASGDAVPGATIKVGSRVRVTSLGKDGEVTAIEDNVATVAVGALRTRAKLTELVAVRGGAATPKAASGPRPKTRDEKVRSARAGAVGEGEPPSRLDIRGQRADDAIRNLEAFLDALYASGASMGLVVHGHGTGALKDAVRDVLKLSPYVETFRAGDRHEGGDGTTVVALRS